MDVLRFELPYPPSINHYYVRTARGVILGAKGKSYRRDVCFMLNKYKDYYSADSRLSLTINVYPPDKRKRDLDNICKAVQDSLQYAGIYKDDNQIDMLTVIRRNVVEHGCLQIWISECDNV